MKKTIKWKGTKKLAHRKHIFQLWGWKFYESYRVLNRSWLRALYEENKK